ncbi:MAG TPA: glycosyltransferase family 39 protein [Candidatus Koribacter sp.]|jgi:hypothetical protein
MSSVASSEMLAADRARIAPLATGPVAALAIANVVFHLLTAWRYGYFIDEFYYYGCSEHLRWGYYDHPPLVAGLMWIATHLFGGSLLGIRVIPSLLGGLLVWVAALTARELGGGRFAQVLTGICVLAAPAYMLTFHFFSMNAVEPVLWTLCVLFAAFAIRREQSRWWVAFGLCCGVGMENKYSIAFLIAGILLGLLLTSARRTLLNLYFWIGMLLALLIFLPNYLWMSHHGFPFLQWRSVMAQRGDMLKLPPTTFVFQMLLWTGATCFVWLAGVGFFLFNKQGRPYRFAGIAAIVVTVTLITMEGKTPYAAPMYAFLFAGGSVLGERLLPGAMPRRIAIGILLITGAILAPCFVPVLSLNRVVAYQSHIPLPLPIGTEKYSTGNKLPQVFSLETGWDSMVQQIATAYNSIPPEQRAQAGILTFHYGTAGAVDLLGPKYGLPKPISTAMSWHDWGPRQYNGEALVLVGWMFPPNYCKRYVDFPPVVNDAMYNGVGLKGDMIHVCYGLRFDLQKQWEGLPWY